LLSLSHERIFREIYLSFRIHEAPSQFGRDGQFCLWLKLSLWCDLLRAEDLATKKGRIDRFTSVADAGGEF